MKKDVKSLQESVATLVRILKIMEPEIDTAHGTLKLNPADVQTMRFVSTHPGCPSVDVSRFLGVGATTVSSIVARLEARGFLERTRPDTDRRAIALALTDEGVDAFQAIEEEELAMAKTMLQQLPQKRRGAFAADMAMISEGLEIAAVKPE